MGRPRPEKVIRNVLEACADCDTCRFLMDESCLLFPELYRLYDKEKEQGCAAGDDELRRLSERCTLCGLCRCPNIRADVIRGKIERVRTNLDTLLKTVCNGFDIICSCPTCGFLMKVPRSHGC